MAQENLFAAADAAARHRDCATELGVDDEEMTSWREAAASMVIPYDQTLGVHPQADGFTCHEVWDFAHTRAEQYPLLLHFPYFDLYRKQVVKQADLVLAMQLHPEAFTQEQKARNFAYYERLTVRDSSLSACVQAVIAAEVGHLDLAEDYLAEAALMDLDDLEHNTTNGLHLASLAGIWTALVAGYGGMRHTDAALSFTPRLPPALTRLAFGLHLAGRTLRVEVGAAAATYSINNGKPLQLLHYGQPVHVSEDQPATCPIPDVAPLGPRPTQPPGRAPHRHHPTTR
jgi:alpha,alpha-trehalose phosphorylase